MVHLLTLQSHMLTLAKEKNCSVLAVKIDVIFSDFCENGNRNIEPLPNVPDPSTHLEVLFVYANIS